MTRFLFSFVLLALSPGIQAQAYPKIFLDSAFEKTDETNHSFYRVVTQDEHSPELFISKTYYKSGALLQIANSRSKDGDSFEGTVKEFWENGQLRGQYQCEKGVKTGSYKTWHQDGSPNLHGYWIHRGKDKEPELMISEFWNTEGQQTVRDGSGYYSHMEMELQEEGEIKKERRVGKWKGYNFRHRFSFEETYDETGNFMSGISTDELDNDFAYNEVMKRPEYNGGMAAFYQFVGKNYKIPEDKTSGGRLILTFVVNQTGKVENANVIKSMGEKYDAAAIEMIYKCDTWIPAKNRGFPIKCSFSLPISIPPSE